MEEIGIIIPAYNPDEQLKKVVEKLIMSGFSTILVINDGSDKENKKYFEKIQDKCILLNNDINMGKGIALKRGFKYVLESELDLKAIVTVDADGQHQIEDIKKVASKILNANTDMCLGKRNLKNAQVPLKRRIGNKIASICFKLRTNYYFEDTQTGLRAIPTQYINDLLAIKGSRYEYEINVLKYWINNKRKIDTVQIEAIYSQNQKTSFHTVKDSLKVFMEIIKN